MDFIPDEAKLLRYFEPSYLLLIDMSSVKELGIHQDGVMRRDETGQVRWIGRRRIKGYVWSM